MKTACARILLLATGLFGLVLPVAGSERPEEEVEKAGSEHWAFQVPERKAPPKLKGPARAAKPLDAFVLAKLEKAGLGPNLEADARILKRRAAFDLTGLPPDFAKAEDLSYEVYVEELLASPAFGERWARLWLDVARYAEDQAHIVGNNKSLTYPNAWMYRDWVIHALNDDLPYDEFLRRQLAADLMFPDDPDKDRAALGFMGLGPKYYRRNDLAVMADEWEDRVDTLSRGVLGLTVACSRCHDHFFDPIPTSDYYALAGVFASSELYNKPLPKTGAGNAKNNKDKQPAATMHLVREAKSMRDLPVYERGDVKAPGAIVPRGFLTVLGGGKRREFGARTSGRLELAEALVSRDNPLTARVWVNRVWAELLGRPLVATTSNFGALGDKPSHPDLLDDLAVRFMEEGDWSLKWLVREIVLSSTYRQSSEAVSTKLAEDPTNELYWRMDRRRLSVEMLRDATFAAAGSLDRAIGGKSYEASAPDVARRAVYVRVSRLKLDPMLALFDFPDPNLHSPGRTPTTTPLQKLFLMNHPLFVKQAKLLAERIKTEAEGEDAAARIRRTYAILFGRPPQEQELALGQSFLAEGALHDYAQALLATNEFAWLD